MDKVNDKMILKIYLMYVIYLSDFWLDYHEDLARKREGSFYRFLNKYYIGP